MDNTEYGNYQFDRGFGICPLAGVDEAGRGPLAGPVVIAGVILPWEPPFYAVNDSKQLTPAQREELAQLLKEDSRVKYAISIKSAQRIDEINILRATHEGMREVALQLAAALTLVDGCKVPSFPVEARFIVKGDAKSAAIAAASILAKTTRDTIMRELDAKYPGYGFAVHNGYGTKQHLEALRTLGPTPEHRRSFAPMKQPAPPNPEQQLELPFL